MAKSYDHPRWGINFEWLAVDPTGCVALFDSGGLGPVPSAVMRQVEQVDEAIDIVDAFPVIGEATKKVLPTAGGDNSYWYNAAARGLYAYDWDLWDGPYQRLASPSRPISIDESPAPVRATAQLVEIPTPFSSTKTVTLAMLP